MADDVRLDDFTLYMNACVRPPLQLRCQVLHFSGITRHAGRRRCARFIEVSRGALRLP